MSNFQVQIEKLTMCVASGFLPQFRRPYKTNGTRATVDAIQERMEHVAAGAPIVGGRFAGIAADFVFPQAEAENSSPINIANGWSTKRLFFFMEVRILNGLGGYITEIIQGYTDHADLSFSNNLDPNLRFYINSITRLNSTVMHNYGPQNVLGVTESFHVIANNDYNGIASMLQPDGGNFRSMRPGDIYGRISADQMMGGASYIDTRQTAIQQARASRRANALPTEYMANIIEGYVTAASKNQFSSEARTVYSGAIGEKMEQPLSKDLFIYAISQMHGSTTVDNFTWRDLLRLDPTIDGRAKLYTNSMEVQRVNHGGTPDIDPAYSEHWNGTDYATTAATIISNGITSIMMQAGATVIDFIASNQIAIGGVPTLEFIDIQGFSQQDMSATVMGLRSRLQSELIDQLSMYNQIPYHIRVRSDINYNTTMMLKFDQQPEVAFVSPTFADALCSPIVTANDMRVNEVASDFDNLLCEVAQLTPPDAKSLFEAVQGSI